MTALEKYLAAVKVRADGHEAEDCNYGPVDVLELVRMLERAKTQLFLIEVACTSVLDPHATASALNAGRVKEGINRCFAELDSFAVEAST